MQEVRNKARFLKRSSLRARIAAKRKLIFSFFKGLKAAKGYTMYAIRTRRGLLAVAALVAAAYLLTACGGGGGDTPTEKAQGDGATQVCTTAQFGVEYTDAAGVKQKNCYANPGANEVANTIWGLVRRAVGSITPTDLPSVDFDMTYRTMPSGGFDEQAIGKKAVLPIQDVDPRYIWLHFRAADSKNLHLKKVLATSRASAYSAAPNVSAGSDLNLTSYTRMDLLNDGTFRITMTDGRCRLVEGTATGGLKFTTSTTTTGC